MLVIIGFYVTRMCLVTLGVAGLQSEMEVINTKHLAVRALMSSALPST